MDNIISNNEWNSYLNLSSDTAYMKENCTEHDFFVSRLTQCLHNYIKKIKITIREKIILTIKSYDFNKRKQYSTLLDSFTKRTYTKLLSINEIFNIGGLPIDIKNTPELSNGEWNIWFLYYGFDGIDNNNEKIGNYLTNQWNTNTIEYECGVNLLKEFKKFCQCGRWCSINLITNSDKIDLVMDWPLNNRFMNVSNNLVNYRNTNNSENYRDTNNLDLSSNIIKIQDPITGESKEYILNNQSSINKWNRRNNRQIILL